MVGACWGTSPRQTSPAALCLGVVTWNVRLLLCSLLVSFPAPHFSCSFHRLQHPPTRRDIYWHYYQYVQFSRSTVQTQLSISTYFTDVLVSCNRSESKVELFSHVVLKKNHKATPLPCPVNTSSMIYLWCRLHYVGVDQLSAVLLSTLSCRILWWFWVTVHGLECLIQPANILKRQGA